MGDHQTHRGLNATIVAQATASGRSGIGIIRVSGDKAKQAAKTILGFVPKVRKATLCNFYDAKGEVLDKGIAIFFQGPESFTGEDTLELQAHGGPVLLDLLLQTLLAQPDIRQANPGEFSEQAFLNGKLDLTQAEAIADMIDAASEQALRSASKSLQGVFSKQIHTLVEALTHLRIFVESAIDFPEEEIDFIKDSDTSERLLILLEQLETIHAQAQTGAVLREGLQVVLAGKPNAGKSSLLNALAGEEVAIVTDIPGTTRDVLKSQIQLDGIPLHILDTAGLRESSDAVEQEGVRRARDEIARADVVLVLHDDTQSQQDNDVLSEFSGISAPILHVYNKIDVSGGKAGLRGLKKFGISATEGLGIEALKTSLKEVAGVQELGENTFIARRRHLAALEKASTHLHYANTHASGNIAAELLAEDLRLAQEALAEITGKFSSDDLLGRIFADFCIGK